MLLYLRVAAVEAWEMVADWIYFKVIVDRSGGERGTGKSQQWLSRFWPEQMGSWRTPGVFFPFMCLFIALCFLEILMNDLKGTWNVLYFCLSLLESAYDKIYICDEYLLIMCLREKVVEGVKITFEGDEITLETTFIEDTSTTTAV